MKIVDMHCDTIEKLYHGKGGSLLRNNLHLDAKAMKAGDYLLQNFAVFVDLKETTDPTGTALKMIARYHREMEQASSLLKKAVSFSDIEQNQETGHMSGVLTLEEGGVLGGRIENLSLFYELGVRMMTLTWNYENELGFPNLLWNPDGTPALSGRSPKGLKAFGIQAVEEMERLGMLVDVSHLSDGGFWDVFSHTKKPFVASHSNAAEICPVCRNLTDPMIRALGERGGAVGINFCEDFLMGPKGRTPESMMEAILAHIRHIVNTGGIEVCGLGSDFDGIEGNRSLGGAEKMQKLSDTLEKSGFSNAQMEKICSGNVLRVYREILK